MKLISYLLAAYLIFLSIIPCCEVDNCSGETTEQTGHQPEKKDCNNCSPFFSCEGCAAATIAYEPIEFLTAAIAVSPSYNLYVEKSLPQAEQDFWQPPRLG